MSDLVEKVAAAIRPTLWDSKDAARAAIAAVAEWLQQEKGHWASRDILLKQLEQSK